MDFTIGTDDFGKVIQQQLCFVDKSLFIKEILDNYGTEATVITRPRRFGKTLNLSMLRYFLAPEVNRQSTKGMFDTLKIAQAGDAYMEHQGKYPVIFITFKEMNDGSFKHACEQLRILLQDTYEAHSYLLTSTKLRTNQKKAFEAILDRKISDQTVLENALKALSRLLHIHHNVKPWILIDEYDTPLQVGYLHNYYDEMIQLMRRIFGGLLKGNLDIHRAVITGILRISKESLFSGLNNLKVYSILNTAYSEHFGFTEAEVDSLLKSAKLDTPPDQIKAWYNGYLIGDQQVYNPWSIMNCVSDKGTLIPYWVRTSGNDLIKSCMASANVSVKEQFEYLLAGKPIEQLIDEHMVFGDLKTNSDALWSLLLFSGYLTTVKIDVVEGEYQCLLRTPNQEVAFLYKHIIRGWFNVLLGKDSYHALLEHLITGQLNQFSTKLQRFLKESSSFFDTNGHHPERFYHGFVLGLIVSLVDTHTVQSNKESGDGRYDVMLIPHDTTQLGLILEFKVADKGTTLKRTAEQALVQINRCDYEAELRQKKIQKILKVGLAFRGKDVEIAWA